MRCEYQNCPYRANQKIALTASEGKISKEVNLCEWHFQLYNEENHLVEASVFKQRLKEIDNGRFVDIINPLLIMDACPHCFYLNPKVTDPALGFRCHSIGSCIAATLSDDFKSYLFWKLGEITEEQHLANINSGKFSKIPDKPLPTKPSSGGQTWP